MEHGGQKAFHSPSGIILLWPYGLLDSSIKTPMPSMSRKIFKTSSL